MNREELLKNAKPILFNTEMVKAILDERKTQFREVFPMTKGINNRNFKLQTILMGGNVFSFTEENNFQGLEYTQPKKDAIKENSKYLVGDILYVINEDTADYLNDLEMEAFSIGSHVTKDFILDLAHVFLKVTNVRVERLQDITPHDIFKEGCPDDYNGNFGFYEWWINLWNSTAKDGYKIEDNSYVFVYESERVEV